MNSIHTCGNCHNEAFLQCSRCQFEHYCSKNCQIADFSRHRTYCFFLPSLTPISQKQMPLYTSSNASVVLSNEIPPSRNRSDQSLPPQMTPITHKVSKISIVDSPKNAAEHRTLNNDSNTSLNVKGEKPEKKQQQQQSSKTQYTPAFDPGVRTAPPNEYNASKKGPPSTTSSVGKRVETPKEPVVQKQPEVVEKPVEETTITKIQTFRRNQQTMLTDRPLVTPKDNRVYIKDLQHRPLKNGKLRVSVMNGSTTENKYYVVELINGIDDYFQHIEENVQAFVSADKTTSYKPVKNEMVLAKFEGDYYRAVCQEVNEGNPTTYHVFFVDYGNSADVKEDEIKPIGPKLKNEIILHTIKMSNLNPKNITKEQAAILSNQEGFEIEVQGRDEETGIYTVHVCGI